MEYVLIFLIGLMCGALVMTILLQLGVTYKKDGNLRIERSDEDGPYLFLELSNAIDTVSKKKWVIFDVIDKNYTRR